MQHPSRWPRILQSQLVPLPVLSPPAYAHLPLPTADEPTGRQAHSPDTPSSRATIEGGPQAQALPKPTYLAPRLSPTSTEGSASEGQGLGGTGEAGTHLMHKCMMEGEPFGVRPNAPLLTICERLAGPNSPLAKVGGVAPQLLCSSFRPPDSHLLDSSKYLKQSLFLCPQAVAHQEHASRPSAPPKQAPTPASSQKPCSEEQPVKESTAVPPCPAPQPTAGEGAGQQPGGSSSPAIPWWSSSDDEESSQMEVQPWARPKQAAPQHTMAIQGLLVDEKPMAVHTPPSTASPEGNHAAGSTSLQDSQRQRSQPVPQKPLAAVRVGGPSFRFIRWEWHLELLLLLTPHS
jgi:cell division septation protein DedD